MVHVLSIEKGDR